MSLTFEDVAAEGKAVLEVALSGRTGILITPKA